MDAFEHYGTFSSKGRKLGPKTLVIVLLAVACLASSFALPSDSPALSSPVYQIPRIRQFYVSPNGTGSGNDRAHPTNVTRATQIARPGDWFWFLRGTYTGLVQPFKNGTAVRPIVFRALPGEHVIINGSFEIKGAYNWIWGFDITDPLRASQVDSGVRIVNRGIRVINNSIHHQAVKNAIGAWDTGPGQVIYGNIVYDNQGHNIYMQNNFFKYGYKQILSNMFLDATCDNCFNIHGYATNDFVTGFDFRSNLVKNGRFLIGGFNAPAEREVVSQNYFYNSLVQFGYRRPTQVNFTKNYLGRSTLDIAWFWGSGEVQFRQSLPNVFTDNQIHRPPGLHIRFTTSANLPTGSCQGCPKIRSVDVFDHNIYSNPFKAFFFANNTNRGQLNFAGWKNATAGAGKAFDTNSVTVPAPTTPKVVILPNQYEPARAHLIIYNWGRRPTVLLNLSPFIPRGSKYAIYQPKDLYSPAFRTGTYAAPFRINTAGQEFLAFVLRRK